MVKVPTFEGDELRLAVALAAGEHTFEAAVRVHGDGVCLLRAGADRGVRELAHLVVEPGPELLADDSVTVGCLRLACAALLPRSATLTPPCCLAGTLSE